MALSIPDVSAASGSVQVVKKVQDQAERDGQAAVALIQAAQIPPQEPDPSGAGSRISLRV
jgi:hypothetical protein